MRGMAVTTQTAPNGRLRGIGMFPAWVAFGIALFGSLLLPAYNAGAGEPAGETGPASPPGAQPPVPDIPTFPAKVPPCNAPEMAARLKSSFDSSDGARDFNVTATAIRDASEVEPDSILATRLDHITPPRPSIEVAVHCKARIQLDNGNVVSQVFRVDVQPATGRETLVAVPIYDTDFDMPALAATPKPAAPPSTPGMPAMPEGGDNPAPVAASPGTLPLMSQRVLPAGVVLCTLLKDVGIAYSGKLGISCFRLHGPSTFVMLSSAGTGRQQVRLTGGEHHGTVAWLAPPGAIRR